ncbi:unnamed protein product [Leptidea sinapis]|uniref:Queuosine 5'-phosphate N-glycosylase/hydrolase n=2 Tax=Leptidea sinapis TaxID=189913 RepID=A0A5E4QW81_9NEOP|nr:unnamed protein product [Leptidea sinapis]
MIRGNILSPSESGRFIAEHSHHVQLNSEGIEKLSVEMLINTEENKLIISSTGTEDIQPSKDHPKAADWIFVTDTLNFCFWSQNKDLEWRVNGNMGYCALEAALYRALKDGYDITNPDYYSKITSEDLSIIMKGDTDARIPLFNERLTVLHEVGAILIDKYNSTFETCILQANKSAVKLLQIIVSNFPCFRDEAVYKKQPVSLYKRAQILVADLWNCFGGQKWGEFHDIDKLTMFADYRVPQVLVNYGVLSYSHELMEKLKNNELLPCGSDEEVEIRGCSIHAVELLKKRLEEKIREEGKSVEVPNSSMIDYYLWCYRRKHAQEMENIPYHKTLGIFY